MTPRKLPLAERAAKGDYEIVVPLDYKLMDELPVEGTMVADMYELGTSVRQLGKVFLMLSPGVIGGRLRALEIQGLTRKIKLVGGASAGGSGTIAWQRTHKGDKLLKVWKEESGVG